MSCRMDETSLRAQAKSSALELLNYQDYIVASDKCNQFNSKFFTATHDVLLKYSEIFFHLFPYYR